MTNLFELFHVGVDVTILVVITKLVRHMTQIEMKVDMMWEQFKEEMGKG